MANTPPTLAEEGLLLPDDIRDIECWPYFQRLAACKGMCSLVYPYQLGPKGMLRSWYRDGRVHTCEAEKIRYTSCLKIRIAKDENKEVSCFGGFPQVQDWRDRASEALGKLYEDQPPPLWQPRSHPPPNFHDYQTTTEEDKARIFADIMSGHSTPSH